MRIILITVLLMQLSGCIPLIAAGVGTSVVMAEDRRSTGTFVDDQGIEIRALARIHERFKTNVAASVTSFNRVVLLTGEVTTEALKREVETVVSEDPTIKSVVNELTVGSLRSALDRSSDSVLTSKVKARMLEAQKFQLNHVKVVSEAGTVYLMGLVRQREGNDAVEIARTTNGVQRVVKVFEYMQ